MSWSKLSKKELEELRPKFLPLEGMAPSFLKTFKIFPCFYDNGQALVLLSSEESLYAVDLLERSSGYSFQVYLADEDLVLELIQKYYETTSEEGTLEEETPPEDVDLLKDLASEAPVVRLVNRLIREAVESRATDIHLEALKEGLRVRFRIDGVLHEVARHPKKLAAPVISRIKLMAKLNIAEHRLPQDGGIRFRVGGEDLDIRVSTIPTVTGEGVVLRLLKKEERMFSLENLGLLEDHYRIIQNLIHHPSGIILVTGPTGSGKTTTLYAALSILNSPDKKIITVEDPVEYQISGINQIQVKPEIGLTFARAIRSILRHDPDIILVGEIRDYETAEIAIQASLTGHLVFSTLHTNDALGAVVRLHEMGIERYLIASATLGLIAQRLVRKLCPRCAQKADPPAAFLKALENLPEKPPEVHYQKPVGCPFCAHTGFRGRTAIYEIVPMDRELRRMILEGRPEDELRAYAQERGYRNLLQDGLIKTAQGITSFEEILRVAR